jgi:membrane protease YdiL (CAAX protease family)
MDTRCGECGARVFDGADWCSQCFAPVQAAPVPTTRPTADTVLGNRGRFGVVEPSPQPVVAGVAAGPSGPAPVPAPAWLPPTPPATSPPPRPTWPPAAPVWPPTGPSGPTLPAPGQAASPESRSVFLTAAGVIVLGALMALATYAWGRSSGAAPTTIIRNSLIAELGFYGLVAAIAVYRAQRVSFRPVWTEGNPADSLVYGALLGLSVGFGLLLLGTLVSGRLTADAGITLIVSDKTPVRIAAAFLLACACAPWVEELLFRGLVAESLRPQGRTTAVRVSAVLFAAWHPQALFPLLDMFLGGSSAGGQAHGSPIPFLYYVGMGAVFARLYLRRGLKASIAAHTAFNGVIVLAAVVSVSGIAHLVGGHGVQALVPGNWSEVKTAPDAAGGVGQVDLDVRGPSTAEVLVVHEQVPAALAGRATPEATVQALMDKLGQNPAVPGIGSLTQPVRQVDYPMGEAVRADAELHHEKVVIVWVPLSTAVWEVVAHTGGSSQAERDIESILQHLTLPSEPGA